MKKMAYLAWLMLLLSRPATISAAVKAPSNPNSAKGCAICHYRWIDTFFIEGKGSDLTEYTSEKVEASPEMCLSCHDGSVRDSRVRINSSSGHKVNVKPPDGMKIPNLFPLDEQGKIQCATCHTAHGVPSGPNEDNTIFMRTSNKDSAMCRLCHADRDGGLKNGHHPIGPTQKEIPEDLTTAWASKRKTSIICETCHTAHGSRWENFLRVNNRDAGLCLACHPDKDSLTANGKKNPTHIVNIQARSAVIPEGFLAKGATLGKNKEIICETCHKVHNSKIPGRLLIAENNAESALCLTCHVDKKGLAATKHNLLQSAPAEKNLSGNTAADAGICSPCHEVHKPARKIPGINDYTMELCLSCHSQGSMAKKIKYTGMAHPINVRPGGQRAGKPGVQSPPGVPGAMGLPLFEKNGGPSANGEITCATCHDPHNRHGDSPSGKTKPGTDAATAVAGSFLRSSQALICRECHKSQYRMKNSKHDLSRSMPESENILKQKPAVSGMCGSCHLIHKEGAAFPWARGPVGEKGPCMTCHDIEGISQKKINTGFSHPLDISPLEKKKTTSLPLYGKSGKQADNGVMKCATCHNPHVWDPVTEFNPQYSEIDGNAQNSFLRLKNSPAPGLCGDCHPEQTRIEKSDHNLVHTAPEAVNRLGRSPLESGICGVCHLSHGDRSGTVLWAREMGPGNAVLEKMCNDCHSKNGSAKNRIPPIASHPEDIVIVNNGGKPLEDKGRFMLFDEISGRPAGVGRLSCPSCHNVHQWAPNTGTAAVNPSVRDATTRFLRSKVEWMPCRDCHGPDALLKFLYFHEPNKRMQRFITTKD